MTTVVWVGSGKTDLRTRRGKVRGGVSSVSGSSMCSDSKVTQW